MAPFYNDFRQETDRFHGEESWKIISDTILGQHQRKNVEEMTWEETESLHFSKNHGVFACVSKSMFMEAKSCIKMEFNTI